MTKVILKKQNWFFEGKEEEEDVILVLHRHWFTLSIKILLVLFFTILPFVMLVVFSSIIVTYNLISIFSFLWVTYYLLLWYWLFYVITMYTLDNWIVTTKRIIDSLQSGFFNRKVSELHLEKIQDVSYRVNGLLATFFNFGVVEIQTAGKEQKFLFEDVPNPQKVKDIIMELILEAEEEENEGKNNDEHPRRPENHILVEKEGVPTPLTTEKSTEPISNI